MAATSCLGSLPNLARHLQRLLSQIPRGRLSTYGDLADALGDRLASRWVATELLQHRHHHPSCACHRVVRVSGELGGYFSGDVADKQAALRREGVACRNGSVALDRHRFNQFDSPRPLAQLREVQLEISHNLSLIDPVVCRRIAGIDVSYHGDVAVAAYVEMECCGDIAYVSQLRQRVAFPYIPTYLAFREAPILTALLHKMRLEHRLADVVMIDGSGILHPHRAGVATLVGVMADHPTIGVTKKLLYGQVDLHGLAFGQWSDVIDPHDGATLGAAVFPTQATRKPLYVSPGHRVSVARARDLIQPWLGTRRLPQPIYWADRISRLGSRSRQTSSGLN